jgi:signal transduction histidine kinase
MLEHKAVEAEVAEGGRERLRRLRKYLDQMGKTLHRVAFELRPTSINELGLTAALTNYTSEWSARCGIEVDFHCADGSLERLSEEVSTTVYRVVQEALTNVLKHAATATAVSIISSRTQTMLRLTIEDDGGGFDPAAIGPPGRFNGLGLAGMRERLSLIGGELEVESSADSGTTIFIRIRLQDERMTA